jgi:hypothetical protein
VFAADTADEREGRREARRDLVPSACVDRACDLAGFRKASHATLGENQGPVDDDFEDPVPTLDEPSVGLKFALELGRQPGGAWLVVSNNAVFDADVHHHSRNEEPMRRPIRSRIGSPVPLDEDRAGSVTGVLDKAGGG